jgi:hypothetical protein
MTGHGGSKNGWTRPRRVVASSIQFSNSQSIVIASASEAIQTHSDDSGLLRRSRSSQ